MPKGSFVNSARKEQQKKGTRTELGEQQRKRQKQRAVVQRTEWTSANDPSTRNGAIRVRSRCPRHPRLTVQASNQTEANQAPERIRKIRQHQEDASTVVIGAREPDTQPS
jgi:hypothetical protein